MNRIPLHLCGVMLCLTAGTAISETDAALPAGTTVPFETGRDAGEANGHWACTTEDGGKLILQFWSNGRGNAGRRAMQWSRDEDAARVVLSFDDGKRTTLHRVATEGRLLNAVDAFDNRVDCERRGALGADNVADSLFGDDSGGLADAIATAGNESWTCTFGSVGGAVEARTLAFGAAGVGSVDGVPARWFVDERGHIEMPYGLERLVMTDVRLADQSIDGTATAFNARERGRLVGCAR